MTEEIWQAIATKYGVPKPSDQDGWDWVIANLIPIAIVEGVKKAACVAVNTLIPCVAVLGHNLIYKKDGDVTFPELLHCDRVIYLCLDEDMKISTRRAVARSTQGVIDRITKAEGKYLEKPRAQLKICKWFDWSKGVDDYFLRHGKNALENVFEKSFDWWHWIDDSFSALGFTPAIIFQQRFELIKLHPEIVLVCFIARKGGGKTWLMKQLAAQAKDENRPLLMCTHRIGLTEANAKELGIPFIGDLDDKVVEVKQVSLVIDSLWKINPQNFAGGVVFIDEIVQVVEHLNTSETCTNKRQKILKTLRELCQVLRSTGGNLVVGDADLNQVTINFLQGLLGGNVEPYIIANEYREPSYTGYLSAGYAEIGDNGHEYHNPADLIATAISYGLEGKRVFLGLTGQGEDSRWGTINVEKMARHYGINDLIRCDSETTKNPEHPAFGVTKKINEACDTYQFVIASTALGVGVSIENQKPFDIVIIVGSGVGSCDSLRQFPMRVRDITVPRLLWIADEGLNDQYKELGRSPTQIDSNSRGLLAKQKQLLDVHDKEWASEFTEITVNQTAVNYINNLITARNAEVYDYCKTVRYGLIKEGVNIVDINEASEIFSIKIEPSTIAELSKNIKEMSIEDLHLKKAAAEIPDKEGYDKLKKQTTYTDEERITLEAAILSRKYGGIELTPEMQEKDADGWYNRLRLLYACTSGNQVLKDLDALSANRHVSSGDGCIIRHDFIADHSRLLQAAFIEKSNILALLNKEIISANDPDCMGVHNFITEHEKGFATVFNNNLKNYKLKTDKFNFQIVRLLLNKLGLETSESGKQRIKGKLVRTYKVVVPNDGRNEIFEKWLAEDTERQKKWSERKHERSVVLLANSINADIDLIEFEKHKQITYFNEIWERVKTDDRIAIINKLEKFSLPIPSIIHLDPKSQKYKEYLADIDTWQVLALDTETYGLDTKNKDGLHARKGRIRLIQISNGQTVYIADLGGREQPQDTTKYDDFLKLLNQKCSDPDIKIIGHNLHFDLRFLKFQLGFNRAKNVQDTMKGLQIFFGDYGGLQVLPGGYGLGNACAKFLGIAVDKTEQKSDWGATLTPFQIEYASRDPFVNWHLYQRIKDLYTDPAKYGFQKLTQSNIRDAWQLENDIIPCAIELEVNGLPIDRAEAQQSLEQCQAIQKQLLDKWQTEVPAFTYSQNQKLKSHLNQKYELNIKSLNKSALADLNHLSEVQLLGKLRAIKVPIQQLESLLRSSEATGRIQTNFKTLTGTGRFSSGDSKRFKDLPNLQSISAKGSPALKEFAIPKVRDCVTPNKSDTQFYIIDQKTASKKLKTYQHILTLTTDEKWVAYINNVIKHLQSIISCPNDIVLVDETRKYSWEDNGEFLNKYKDYDPAIKTCARLVQNRVIAIVDLAASHGRIAADVADDEVAILGCNDESIDNHSKVAEYVARALGESFSWEEIQANKKNQPYKSWRDTAKNTYYGWLNGAGAKRVQEQTKANSGQIVSIEACQASIKGCENLYPNVVNFRNNLVAELSNKANLQFIDGKYYA
ncbi:MAG: DUF3854 domain-containing protein, partial [Rhizonema sp. NSF051]|nr:DUF3854 domain-containing protein [Rhizonema sp. NSF051]